MEQIFYELFCSSCGAKLPHVTKQDDGDGDKVGLLNVVMSTDQTSWLPPTIPLPLTVAEEGAEDGDDDVTKSLHAGKISVMNMVGFCWKAVSWSTLDCSRSIFYFWSA